jgi:hypothetical protein
MVFHMKTTLIIDDTVMQQLREQSARSGRTISDLVESALRLFLEAPTPRARLPPLPRWRSRGTPVDVADREALYRRMEEE